MSEDVKNQGADEVEFGDKKVQTTVTTRYQGKEGVTDRVAIVSQKLLRAYVHWHEKKNFSCLSANGKTAICCQQIGPPEQKFGLLLFQYATDEDGEMLTDGLRGKPKIWIFSEKKYDQLKPKAKQHPIMDQGADEAQVDLLIRCESEEWQKLDFTPCKEAHYKTKPEFYQAVTGKRDRLLEKLRVFLAPVKSEREVAELLGIHSGSAPAAADDDEVNLEDIMGED